MKILVSAVQFRPWPPHFGESSDPSAFCPINWPAGRFAAGRCSIPWPRHQPADKVRAVRPWKGKAGAAARPVPILQPRETADLSRERSASVGRSAMQRKEQNGSVGYLRGGRHGNAQVPALRQPHLVCEYMGASRSVFSHARACGSGYGDPSPMRQLWPRLGCQRHANDYGTQAHEGTRCAVDRGCFLCRLGRG